MPTLNHARYIGAAIDGVLGQQYPSIELLVGDDVSTDGTREILRGLEAARPGILRVELAEKRRGFSENLNHLFSLSSGDYIAITSGDDVWLPGKLARQVEALLANPLASVCFGRVDVFDDETAKSLRISLPDGFETGEAADPIAQALQLVFDGGGTTAVVGREFWPTSGFRTEVGSASDWLFFIEVLLRGPAIFIEATLARYRRHSGNYSRRVDHALASQLVMFDVLQTEYPELREMVDRNRKRWIVEFLVPHYLGGEDLRLLDGLFHRWSARVPFARLAKTLVSELGSRSRRRIGSRD